MVPRMQHAAPRNLQGRGKGKLLAEGSISLFCIILLSDYLCSLFQWLLKRLLLGGQSHSPQAWAHSFPDCIEKSFPSLWARLCNLLNGVQWLFTFFAN